MAGSGRAAAVAAVFFALLALCAAQSLDPNAVQFNKARFLRKNVNNLTALTRFAAEGSVVVTSLFNRGYRHFAANWHYTITRFGRVRTPLQVVYDEASLETCLTLGFACYNGSDMLRTTYKDWFAAIYQKAQLKESHGEHSFVSEDVSHGNKAYYILTWGKALFVRELLARNYSVLLSDLDTVWLKNALRTFSLVLEKHDADMLAMNDQNSGKPNSGNFLLRVNRRTQALADAWVAGAAPDFHDQQGLWNLMAKMPGGWLACTNTTTCLAAKAQNMVALWLHPWHGCPWQVKYDPTPAGVCDDKHAYLHIFCTAGGTSHKRTMAKDLGLWFVDPDETRMVGARAHELVDAQTVQMVKSSPLPLPCANDVAWQQL